MNLGRRPCSVHNWYQSSCKRTRIHDKVEGHLGISPLLPPVHQVLSLLPRPFPQQGHVDPFDYPWAMKISLTHPNFNLFYFNLTHNQNQFRPLFSKTEMKLIHSKKIDFSWFPYQKVLWHSTLINRSGCLAFRRTQRPCLGWNEESCDWLVMSARAGEHDAVQACIPDTQRLKQ